MRECSINIYCESSEEVVKSKGSSHHLGKILNIMGLRNRKQLIKNYNRIKNKDESLTKQELNDFINFVDDSEFEVAYKEYIDGINIQGENESEIDGNKEKISFENIKITIEKFIESINIIKILKGEGKQYHRDWGVTYGVLYSVDKVTKKTKRSRTSNKIVSELYNQTTENISELKKSRIETSKDNNYYYEVIEGNEYFEVGKNLKSSRYILIDKNKGEVIFDSDEIFNIGDELTEGIYFLDGTLNDKVGIISNKGYNRVDSKDWVECYDNRVFIICGNKFKIEINCINGVMQNKKINCIIPYRRTKGEIRSVSNGYLYYKNKDMENELFNYKMCLISGKVEEDIDYNSSKKDKDF